MYYALGTLLFAAIAIVVVVAAVQRSKRVPCTSCGLSISPSADHCPYCKAQQHRGGSGHDSGHDERGQHEGPHPHTGEHGSGHHKQ